MQRIIFWYYSRKRDRTELMDLKSLELNMEAKSCRRSLHKLTSVDSAYEDSGTFSQARTRDWLLQQRQRSICRSCRESMKSEENGTQISSPTQVTCYEKDSVHLRTEAEICQLMKKQCPCTC